MLYRYRIRSLIHLGVAMLAVIVVTLAAASVFGMLKFRKLTRDIRQRATELPLAAELSNEVSQLRATLWQCHSQSPHSGQLVPQFAEQFLPRQLFRENLRGVAIALDQYHVQLTSPAEGDARLVDTTGEQGLVRKMQESLRRIGQLVGKADWDLGQRQLQGALEDELEDLQLAANSIPALLKERMDLFASQARTEYHLLIWLATATGCVGLGLLVGTAWMFNGNILRPLRQLIGGARRVAAGEHSFRIELRGSPEMREVARAFNHMTATFEQINEDLAEKVKQRTREVIRSEQLASVGLLAAGVAHEINNPLASIAWSAEALDARLDELLPAVDSAAAPDEVAKREGVRKYLRRIQDEAFRCKKITCGLLDFSRLGDSRKVSADLREIVVSVIDMVRPLGRYAERTIELVAPRAVRCEVHPQEFRQVVLNLLTNGLDSLGEGGTVRLKLSELAGEAVLEVVDEGCGMTPEVMQNLFEPFFTRRRDGQGTGLGLSITWRIVDEHGGQIHVHSDGPGRGSRFEVCLPLKQHVRESSEKPRLRAAA